MFVQQVRDYDFRQEMKVLKWKLEFAEEKLKKFETVLKEANIIVCSYKDCTNVIPSFVETIVEPTTCEYCHQHCCKDHLGDWDELDIRDNDGYIASGDPPEEYNPIRDSDGYISYIKKRICPACEFNIMTS